jgi:hypothetical protein
LETHHYLATDSPSNPPITTLVATSINIPQGLPIVQQTFKLDTKLFTSKFDVSLNGDKMNSWIHSFESYFNYETQSNLLETNTFFFIRVHMEDQVLTWWKTHVASFQPIFK